MLQIILILSQIFMGMWIVQYVYDMLRYGLRIRKVLMCIIFLALILNYLNIAIAYTSIYFIVYFLGEIYLSLTKDYFDYNKYWSNYWTHVY